MLTRKVPRKRCTSKVKATAKLLPLSSQHPALGWSCQLSEDVGACAPAQGHIGEAHSLLPILTTINPVLATHLCLRPPSACGLPLPTSENRNEASTLRTSYPLFLSSEETISSQPKNALGGDSHFSTHSLSSSYRTLPPGPH